MERKYNFNFDFWKINVDVLKEKEVNKILWILSQSRHTQDISLNGYGTMTFDEEKDPDHLHPSIEMMDAFNRRRSNVMVMDIHMKNGTTYFDKMFIYHSNNKRIGNYGFVLYNTVTKDQRHQYFIYDDLNDIIQHINKTLNRMQRNDDGKFRIKEHLGGVEKTQYIGRDGKLLVNDWCRIQYSELPKIAVDKQVYRNNKSFIEM